MKPWSMAFALSLAAGMGMAQAPDMTGTWQLNVAKSNWGKHPKPIGSTIVIQHHESAMQYSGSISTRNGGENSEDRRTFQFDGAIDGKPYPVTGTLGNGTMTIRRVNPFTTVSELKSTDGKLVETATTAISADGKRLVREVRSNGPEGQISWTEVYDKQ